MGGLRPQRLRFYRRNWKRMYPEESARLHARAQRYYRLRSAVLHAVAVALLIVLVKWLVWGLR